ncbi:[Acyl-carrier-protein] S-malonyltransferase [Cyclonatronum proteinivorum]|uniref:Malonyl CoA-acyl carrier protein transacylase n=2 Tax=Cyclonatronum proteinivorum TaxID=1457365 RepID=A0A345UM35_9BACT|nr:[Acyl-carrier-protein] S-malonyltransferase [Cyclonatronum proteinivorum]
MGKAHYESDPVFRKVFDEANEILGFSLSEIMFEGPDESLRQTENTQPAIFLHSIALFKTLDLQADAVAGHSLGEFSALAAAGVLSFEDALRVVRKRGQLMQQAGTDNPGTMAAVIGMADEKVAEICKEASKGADDIVVPANYNCPGQLVISGHETAIDRALVLLKEQGCKIAKKLPVSGAFHSPLMQSAYDGLKAELDQVSFHTPSCPVYANYTARPTTSADEIKENLLSQLLNPVKWTQTLLQMKEDGLEAFTEVGPGNVLQGLVKRTLKGTAISGHQ